MFQTSLSLDSCIALFSVMLVLAIIPSVSVMVVTARTISHGFKHGLYTTVGIIAGDVLFILLAVLSLTFLANIMGELFSLIKYLGGAYLICLGIILWLSKKKVSSNNTDVDTSAFSSFLAGLLITLGDQKAILFYLGFLPAFLNFTMITYLDVFIIIFIAIIAICFAKIGYAYMAYKSTTLIGEKTYQYIDIAAGTIMIVIGLFIFFKP